MYARYHICGTRPAGRECCLLELQVVANWHLRARNQAKVLLKNSHGFYLLGRSTHYLVFIESNLKITPELLPSLSVRDLIKVSLKSFGPSSLTINLLGCNSPFSLCSNWCVQEAPLICHLTPKSVNMHALLL